MYTGVWSSTTGVAHTGLQGADRTGAAGAQVPGPGVPAPDLRTGIRFPGKHGATARPRPGNQALTGAAGVRAWCRGAHVEELKRFVAGEPPARVHECVFGVLALESEPIARGFEEEEE
jgi:hypothetical protein